MKKNKTKLVFDCDIGRCPNGSDPNYDCAYICNSCELCTQDGMVITKVRKKYDNVVLGVRSVSGDEFIFYSENPRRFYSMKADTDKFDKEFKVVETTEDIRGFW